jgi:2-polyprenyl-3-methyl-5-hydroxy-6-metoxy-1,4-benzoquinol methylase
MSGSKRARASASPISGAAADVRHRPRAAYPHALVTGYDLDEASVADAQRNAAERGVNVRFVCKDAAAMAEDGPFDLVLLLETLPDMSRPREVLEALRATLAPSGSVVIADERVAEEFVAPGRRS